MDEHTRALWIDRHSDITSRLNGNIHRVYFGHESCQYKLPSTDEFHSLMDIFAASQKPVTLVTPVLNANGLNRVLAMVNILADRFKEFEVVCNDWGLLFELTKVENAEAVIGRFLSGQFVDPRFSRVLNTRQNGLTVRHFDGTLCDIAKQAPSDSLTNHLKSISIDRCDVFEFFSSLNVRRCEISAVSHGLDISGQTDWKFSLHDNVPLAQFRWCPEYSEHCVHSGGDHICEKQVYQIWELHNAADKCWENVFRKDNVIYYRLPDAVKLSRHPNIDRLVTKR